MRNKIIVYILLSLIVITGFWFRFKGILDNHSFWQDEAFVASLGRDIILGKRNILGTINLLNYQPLHVYITSISLKIFGLTEFAARLPTVIFGSLGIIGAYLLASRLSNRSGGLLAAFIVSISQLNLANSTQAKPYIAIQTLVMFELYLIDLLTNSKKHRLAIHVSIISIIMMATFFHYLGILSWIPYLVSSYKYFIRKTYFFLILVLALIASTTFFSGFSFLKGIFFSAHNTFFTNNNLTYLRELLWKNYGFISLSAIFAILSLALKRNHQRNHLSLGVIIWISVLVYVWTFVGTTHNIRYLVPLFGVLFIYFGVFWALIGNYLFHKKSWFVCLIVALILFAGGNKTVKKPANYYSPNLDFYGDIQIADYKNMFLLIKKKYPDLSSVAIFNDWIEAQLWYLPEKPVTAYFMKGQYAQKPIFHHIDGAPIYGSLPQFLEEKAKYKKGLLIVEDWESILPEDIKHYAKKNMRLEVRVDSLKDAPNDPWPLEIYSWGL